MTAASRKRVYDHRNGAHGTSSGIIVTIGFPKIRGALDPTNVRSARVPTGTRVATAHAAAIQRGCVAVVHFDSSATTVWLTTTCPRTVDTVSGVQNVGALSGEHGPDARRAACRSRGLAMGNLSGNTVVRFTGTVASNRDVTVITPVGKVVHG